MALRLGCGVGVDDVETRDEQASKHSKAKRASTKQSNPTYAPPHLLQPLYWYFVLVSWLLPARLASPTTAAYSLRAAIYHSRAL